MRLVLVFTSFLFFKTKAQEFQRPLLLPQRYLTKEQLQRPLPYQQPKNRYELEDLNEQSIFYQPHAEKKRPNIEQYLKEVTPTTKTFHNNRRLIYYPQEPLQQQESSQSQPQTVPFNRNQYATTQQQEEESQEALQKQQIKYMRVLPNQHRPLKYVRISQSPQEIQQRPAYNYVLNQPTHVQYATQTFLPQEMLADKQEKTQEDLQKQQIKYIRVLPTEQDQQQDRPVKYERVSPNPQEIQQRLAYNYVLKQPSHVQYATQTFQPQEMLADNQQEEQRIVYINQNQPTKLNNQAPIQFENDQPIYQQRNVDEEEIRIPKVSRKTQNQIPPQYQQQQEYEEVTTQESRQGIRYYYPAGGNQYQPRRYSRITYQ